MTSPAPSILMHPGLAIGYGTVLARLEEEVVLGGGTHFLLARNGRGKTTLLRTLAGSHKPMAGSFQSSGFTQYLPEDLRFDPEMTAKSLFRTLLPADRCQSGLALAERIELDVHKPYGRLSTGNRRKTSLIIAEYSVRPDCGNILLLDEPFSGLDIFARQAFEELWRQSAASVLRLVSCHPDYDAMELPSTLLIEGGSIRYLHAPGQAWNGLKKLLL